ncbi:MAG: deoxyuridine 5'-triphosphate nucleotidohydrolase [Candidatus Omnitrophota bacterium]|nr:deoxyuridine 5'-triphosphate nucleotidohydrolase [Candidatus Omnitrophota bacterium]
MLNKQEIKTLIEQKKLIESYINFDTQLTPNGFDLTIGKIFTFNKSGSLDFSNNERIIPETKEIIAKKKKAGDKFGWWHLKKGTYKIRTNETVNLPNDLVALAFSRTSLLRMGAFTQHGVWDAGFCGKGEFILEVGNSKGIKLKQNCRIAQLVFLKANETESYQGIYKNLK